MRLKELHAFLQDVEDFSVPKQHLEQYITGPHLASRLLFTIAESFEDFEQQVVVDLGCGTGMLAVGCALLGCQHVIAMDIDSDALSQAQRNCDRFEGLPVDFVQADVAQMGSSGTCRLQADVVICNPPFGSWRKGADCEFLGAAFKVSTGAVYSLHKRSTRTHIQRFAQAALGTSAAAVIAELAYDLPATYSHHKKKSKDIEVDLWRFEVKGQA